jgi:hypothetical protein
MPSSPQAIREALEIDRLIQKVERVKGIEPSYSAWKAAALPLSYTRIRFWQPDARFPYQLPITNPCREMVDGVGFEPT